MAGRQAEEKWRKLLACGELPVASWKLTPLFGFDGALDVGTRSILRF